MKKFVKNKYLEFTPEWSGFDIKYHVAGYFEHNPMLQIYFIWGKLFLHLPWKHYKKIEREKTLKEQRKDKLNKFADKNFRPKKVYKRELYDECDPPTYGIYFHMNQLGICYGRNTKLYDMPWNLEWIRTSALKKDGTWIHETKNNRNMDFWDSTRWKDILFSETHPYKYVKNNGEIQTCNATIAVHEREWRWKWFKWLKWTRYIRRVIEIEFSDDIGEGDWKGGVTGCNYDILPNETPYECLKRMEKERRFK